MNETALPLKHDVRRAFDRAAPRYDAHAEFQRLICERLIDLLTAHAIPTHGPMLDAGCGTGYGAARLHGLWPAADILCMDFAPAMLGVQSPVVGNAAAARIGGDIERLPLRSSCLALWFSNLALQWCAPEQAFAEAYRALAPGGLLAASSLGPATLHELRAAFAGLDAYRHVNDFVDASRLAIDLRTCGFELLHAQGKAVTLYRTDLRAILLELKAIGASHVGQQRRPGAMGRRTWNELVRAYETRRTAAGLPVTYDAIYLLARKPQVA